MCLSYQTILTRLACWFQHLQFTCILYQKECGNIAKVLCLHVNAPVRG